MAKKQRATLRQVWEIFMVHVNPDDAAAALKRLAPSRAVIRKAIKDLQAAGRTNTVLMRYAEAQGWTMDPVSRRPKVNDVRDYSVLDQNNGGGPFVRVPVSSLGLSSGDRARVRFLDGQINLVPAPG